MSTVIDRSHKKISVPVGDSLIFISRTLNRIFHGKKYMFCSSVWIITHGGSHRGWFRGSVLFRFISKYGLVDSLFRYTIWILYVPINCSLDVVFFFKSIIVKLFFKEQTIQLHHCSDCVNHECNIIPSDDWSGAWCPLWRNIFRFWR